MKSKQMTLSDARLLTQFHAGPDMIVISGALTPAGNVDDLAVDDIEYLEQMYASGARGSFDVLGAHPSGTNCPALADWRTVTPDEAGADPDSSLFTERYHSWCFLGTLEGYREVLLFSKTDSIVFDCNWLLVCSLITNNQLPGLSSYETSNNSISF